MALSMVLCIVGCGSKPRPGTPPEHVLLITIENLRADHVTHLGYERRTTALLRPDQPSVLDIDSVPLSGVAFSRAYAPGADPRFALASLMGSADALGAGERSLKAAFAEGGTTLAEAFQGAGYVTSCFVASRSLGEGETNHASFARGFDHASFHGSDKETLGAAVPWLSATFPKGGKHFTWVHLADIQKPLDGEPFRDRLSVPLPADGPAPGTPEFLDALAAAGTRPTLAQGAHLNDQYDGQLVRTTELVNSFFFLYRNEFGVEGLWDDSLVVVAGATGFELGEGDGGVGDPESLREEALNVPILMSHRGSLTGERIFQEVVELRDLGATLRDWFRLKAGDPDAHSLLAITDSYVRRVFPRSTAFSFNGTPGDYSLRTDRYRLVHRGGASRLHDLHGDPSGALEVSAEFPELVAELEEQANERWRRLGFVP